MVRKFPCNTIMLNPSRFVQSFRQYSDLRKTHSENRETDAGPQLLVPCLYGVVRVKNGGTSKCLVETK